MPNGTLPPPQEFDWEMSLKDFILTNFILSDNLLANPPRCLRLYAERIQINWQQSGLDDGSEASVMEMTFSARPVAPATIVLNTTNALTPSVLT
jgi:hypothetical protein